MRVSALASPFGRGGRAERGRRGENVQRPSQSPSAPAPPEGEPRRRAAQQSRRPSHENGRKDAFLACFGRSSVKHHPQNDVNAKTSPPHRNTVQAGRKARRGKSRGGYGFGARERDSQCPLWLLLSGISCQHKKYPRRRHPATTTSSIVRT